MKSSIEIACLLLFTLLLNSCKKEIEANSTPLVLISWNCDNFQLSLDTLHQAATFINSQNPDIVCLQERPHTNLVSYDSIRTAFPQLPYKATNDREDENLNIAIFSKYPLRNIHTWYFQGTYNKMIQADVNQNGKWFRLYNVHLQTTGHGKDLLHNCHQRYLQSDLLKEEIQKSTYPVLVCGDFNDLPISYTVLNLLTESEEQNNLWEASYQPIGGIFKIDYIFTKGSWKKDSYQLFSNPWSDHKIQKIEFN